MKKRWKTFLRGLASALLAAALCTGFFIAKNGVPLWGVPKPGNVARVIVRDEEAGRTEEFTDSGKIELACKLLNSLNYQMFTPLYEDQTPDIQVTYVLKDGRELSAGANWVTGWWNGKAYVLKKPDMFVNLAKGIFFSGGREAPE